MVDKVVDASALAALLFGEPEAAFVAGQISGASLIAPALLDFELANVCRTKCRRHPDQEASLVAAFLLRARLGVRELAVDLDRVVELANQAGLTGYDASYLWLSSELEAELVTLDAQLAKAAATLRQARGRPSRGS